MWGGSRKQPTPPPVQPPNNSLFSPLDISGEFLQNDFLAANSGISLAPINLAPPVIQAETVTQNDPASFFDNPPPTFQQNDPPPNFSQNGFQNQNSVPPPQQNDQHNFDFQHSNNFQPNPSLPQSFQNLASKSFTPPPPPSFSSANSNFQPPPPQNFVPPQIPEVRPHWFHFQQDEPKSRPHPANFSAAYPPSEETQLPTYSWVPLSRHDSAQLEDNKTTTSTILTDGGKFEVDLVSRQRRAIFWQQDSQTVARVTWFFRTDGEYKYHPFDEQIAEEIEHFYVETVKKGVFPQRKELGPGDLLIVHSAELVIEALEKNDEIMQSAGPTTNSNQMLVRILKRGITDTHFEADLPPDEIGVPDHLVFVVHGVGEVADFKFRKLIDCTNDMRTMGLQMTDKHFEADESRVNRTEFLPVQWYDCLHGDDQGIDENLRKLSLPSIKRLRDFTNGTLMDILLYSSPVYCQRVIDAVNAEVHRLHSLFLEKFPNFTGKISFAGHSLGALIFFDLLCNQKTLESQEASKATLEKKRSSISLKPPAACNDSIDSILSYLKIFSDVLVEKFRIEEVVDLESLKLLTEEDLQSLEIGLGPRRKILKFVGSDEEIGSFHEFLEAQKNQNEEDIEPMMMDSLSILTLGSVEVKFNYQQFDGGVGQPVVKYPQLPFDKIHAFFALGSPISMFLSVRGIEELGTDFQLPTTRFFEKNQ